MADATVNTTPAAVTFPHDVELTLTFKVKVYNQEVLEYYEHDDHINVIADIVDILDDQLFGTLESINGMNKDEIRRRLNLTT